MIWMLRSKPSRYALRVDVAATSATLREQLIDVRDVTAAIDPEDPRWSAVRMRAKETRTHFFSAALRLPRVERQLAFQWEHAAAMTYWYITGDRGFGPLEEQAAKLLAALPDGLDVTAAEETVDAIGHRSEMAIRRTPKVGRSRKGRSPTVVDQKGLRDRIANDRAGLAFQDIFAPQTATSRQAHRHYFPWIAGTLDYLSKPRSRFELEAVLAQWRNEREKYIDTNREATDIVIRPDP
ncbi:MULTISPECIES: hypothetical protein [Rhodococcus]|uniref:hypothetical protein n=1 Tax=Rhodococcus TaxID=1827 RepID=UPI0006BA134A|nr:MULTISPECIES: hypothetical protein [Rhodococcus]KPH20730.1 hypothetical protein AN948_05605 [Rhodococcus sp. ADH]